jgi:hypothetical protein
MKSMHTELYCPYTCQFCQKTFHTEQSLTDHLRNCKSYPKSTKLQYPPSDNSDDSGGAPKSDHPMITRSKTRNLVNKHPMTMRLKKKEIP